MSATEIGGRCDERFTEVRDAFEAVVAGDAGGASAAVFLDGEPVVDLWGGYADQAQDRAWERDTLTNVWSISKTMTNLCAIILADQGELDLHAPVARYWPQFAAAGKDAVEVRHLLSHTAGLPGWDEPLKSPGDLYDWDRCTGPLAAQRPWWEPGSVSGYHALTQGYLVGEVVRRITGQSPGSFFAERVAGPLGADFHIGLPAADDDRVADVFNLEGLAVPPELQEMSDKVFGKPNVLADPSRTVSTRAWRAAEIPAGNGHGNARSVATVQSVIACGGEVGGVRLLSEKGVQAIFDQQIDGVDLLLRTPVKFGMGWALGYGGSPFTGARTCYWGGAGGHMVTADCDNRLVVAYMMSHMKFGGRFKTTGDERFGAIVKAAYHALNRG
ncbi:serine hydrolase domain-containing protein [Actinomadura gamaensis]|uniref:Serine hydrolase domain-containing protein n=1 Tax=Actinomadura gamaensis TaxID=1763541 RepID=A0ABV9TTC9_9ACTN